MKYLKATDSNGTELYLFQLEGNCFISIPKEQLEFKPLSLEELKEIKGVVNEKTNYDCTYGGDVAIVIGLCNEADKRN